MPIIIGNRGALGSWGCPSFWVILIAFSKRRLEKYKNLNRISKTFLGRRRAGLRMQVFLAFIGSPPAEQALLGQSDQVVDVQVKPRVIESVSL